MQDTLTILTPILGLAGLAAAFGVFRYIRKQPAGEGKEAEIASQIHKGAMVFMRREIVLISIFAVIIGVALLFKDVHEAGAFFYGALCSSFAGFVGMYTATKANVRTAVAARDSGAPKALGIAFFGGSIMGLSGGLDGARRPRVAFPPLREGC